MEGDPLAHLVRRYPAAFAAPISIIYNEINATGSWPAKWKREHLTIIPKVPNPAGLSECRNISCTSIFSKILEGEVMAQLRRELDPHQDQYGGTPKCGAEHMLVDILDKIMAAMEGGENVAVLLGVDYEKAFNRMDHAECLRSLRRLGASAGSIALVRAFLENREMTISIGDARAEPVKIRRGSPQGSILGCLLYCVTTQGLTEGLRGPPDEGNAGGLAAFLYVDDTTLFDSVPVQEAIKHFSTQRTVADFPQLTVGADFTKLSDRADDIGMKINAKKTQLLVVSPPNGCTTTASFRTGEGVEVASVDKMKLVGFTFGNDPGVSAHVEAVVDKFKRKKWMLYHMHGAGFRGGILYKLYCCYVRSVIEYCSPVYHSLLNAGQELQLERLQRHAVRVCYGCEEDVESIMARENIETLKARRARRCDAFIKKAAANPRFSH